MWRLAHELIGRVSNLMMVGAALFSFGMAFYIVADVVARNAGIPLYGTAEFIRNAIVAVIFLQLPYCVHSNGMLRAGILAELLPDGGGKVLLVLGCALGACFFGAVAYGAFEPALRAWIRSEAEGEGAVRIATWPARFAIVGGCSLAALVYVLKGIEAFGVPVGKEPAPSAEPD